MGRERLWLQPANTDDPERARAAVICTCEERAVWVTLTAPAQRRWPSLSWCGKEALQGDLAVGGLVVGVERRREEKGRGGGGREKRERGGGREREERGGEREKERGREGEREKGGEGGRKREG